MVFLTLAIAAAVATVMAYRLLGERRGRPALSAILGVLIVAVAIQAVPYGWARSNPPSPPSRRETRPGPAT